MIPPTKVIVRELVALSAQCGVFLVGLVISLFVGMVLAGRLDGVGGLLFCTVLSGAGLLGSA